MNGGLISETKEVKLDEYRNEIKDKLAIKRITVQGVYSSC